MIDAHNHLHQGALEGVRQAGLVGCSVAVVNGTSPKDWPQVRALKKQFPGTIRAAYGTHPWQAQKRHGQASQDLQQLEALLIEDPGAGVGEIGLDRWIKGHDARQQLEVLKPQMQLAERLDRPVSFHCLKAFGHTLQLLEAFRSHAPRILLHACAPPKELQAKLMGLGCRFSYNLSFAQPRKAATEAFYAALPPEQLLVETDAPSMPPPAEFDAFQLQDPATGRRLNDPRNLKAAYQRLATLRGVSPEVLEQQTRDTLEHWWSGGK